MIYLVEDDSSIRELVIYALNSTGLEAKGFEKPSEFWKAVEEEEPSLVILDVMLPEESGIDVLKKIRSNPAIEKLPVIMETAKTSEYDRINGLESGADDYISKPFMPQELLLRVYAVLRRTYKEDSPRVFLDGCTIDFSRAEVNKGGEIIPLTAKEHTLLETLARNEGKIVTVDALCEALWGDNPFGYENSLNAHVRRIREKIEADPSKPVSLITIKGLGYKLITRK